MKKSILKLVSCVFLCCLALGGYSNIASAEAKQSVVYQEELFRVTYSVNDEWDGNTVNATLEIENIGSETIENWYLGMSLEGEINDIWNATIYEHEEDQYVIKNAVYNGDIAPGEKVCVGCIIEFGDGVQKPNGFYMPIETKAVSSERYEADANIVSAWETGSEYQMFIKNASWQTIEDWTMEFDFEGDIISIWNAEIVEKEGSHYRLTNSDYNGMIAYGESITIGFITSNGKPILPKNVTLNEITSEGIKDAEKLVDERNFEDFDFVTEEYEVTPLYTLDGQVSAYLVQYYSSGEPTGYIVVSNEVDCLDYYIEFGTGSAGIIEDMIDMVEAECDDEVERVIYVGGYTYYALVGNDVYGINEMEPYLLAIEDMEKMRFSGDETQYYEWKVTLSLADIFAKEVGYSKMTSKDSPNVPSISKFIKMSDAKDAYYSIYGKWITNHCGPTAGLNYLIYLDYNGYTPRNLTGDRWEYVFCELYDKMKTGLDNTTYDDKYASAFEMLFSSYAPTKVERIYEVSWEKAIDCLSDGALTLLLQDSQIYGNHYVLGVGYNTFSFSSGWTSRYFKIVDGWSDSEFRYVNYSLGIDLIGAIKVTPGYECYPLW